MSASTADSYLTLQADDRFEARVPTRLKRDAEAVARARGESLSQYVLRVLAEKVSDDLPLSQEWLLTPAEQARLLQVLAASPTTTPALEAAGLRAEAIFGPAPIP